MIGTKILVLIHVALLLFNLFDATLKNNQVLSLSAFYSCMYLVVVIGLLNRRNFSRWVVMLESGVFIAIGTASIAMSIYYSISIREFIERLEATILALIFILAGVATIYYLRRPLVKEYFNAVKS